MSFKEINTQQSVQNINLTQLSVEQISSMDSMLGITDPTNATPEELRRRLSSLNANDLKNLMAYPESPLKTNLNCISSVESFSIPEEIEAVNDLHVANDTKAPSRLRPSRKRTKTSSNNLYIDNDHKAVQQSPKRKVREVKGRVSHVFELAGEEYEVKTSGSRGVQTPHKWLAAEDKALSDAVAAHGERNWKAISALVPGRNHVQCLQRWKKVLRPGLKKGHWTEEEDTKLRELVTPGLKHWGLVAAQIPGRVAKQCRERWSNHLDPMIKKGNWEAAEDAIILQMHDQLGNKWAAIAKMLPRRTENSVKIRWKSLTRKYNRGGAIYNNSRKGATGSRKTDKHSILNKSLNKSVANHIAQVVSLETSVKKNSKKKSSSTGKKPVKALKKGERRPSVVGLTTLLGGPSSVQGLINTNVDFTRLFTEDTTAATSYNTSLSTPDNNNNNNKINNYPPSISNRLPLTSAITSTNASTTSNTSSSHTDTPSRRTSQLLMHGNPFNLNKRGSSSNSWGNIEGYIDELDNNLDLDAALGSITSDSNKDIFALYRANPAKRFRNRRGSNMSMNSTASHISLLGQAAASFVYPSGSIQEESVDKTNEI